MSQLTFCHLMAAVVACFTAPLAAHTHGTATLQISLDTDPESGITDVSAELRASGLDLVGFEHAASTENEQRTETETLARLLRGDWLKWGGDSGCATVQDSLDTQAAAATESEQHDEHRDWIVRIRWRCSSTPPNAQVRFDGLSASIESLDAQYVAARSQGADLLTPEAPMLELQAQ